MGSQIKILPQLHEQQGLYCKANALSIKGPPLESKTSLYDTIYKTMANNILRGSTCGAINLHPDLACYKCKPSIKRQRDTGKISKQKIT